MGKLLILSISMILFSSCGWFKGKKKKSAETSAAAAITPENPMQDPNKLPIGPESTGAELALAEFAPNMTHACKGQLVAASYQALIDSLGGVQFARPLSFFRNENDPYLIVGIEKNKKNRGADGGQGASPEAGSVAESSKAENDADDAAPGNSVDIKRADLIGRSGSKVIFLSKTHGLFLVETAGTKPVMSCTVMVPGQAKNFYIKDNHLILLANHRQNRGSAAVITYEIRPDGLKYKTHFEMQDAQILDSRLFNDTLVTYTRIQEQQPTQQFDAVIRGGAAAKDYSDSNQAYRPAVVRYQVTALNNLLVEPNIVFEDLLANDEIEVAVQNAYSETDIGSTVSKRINFKEFISASDKYFVVTKEVHKTVVESLQTRRSSYRTCTNFNPQAYEYRRTYCSPIWEKVSNPEFDGAFSCHNDPDFGQCVAANENKFIKSYWNYKGKNCQEHVSFRGRCEAYETRVVETNYPVYQQRVVSELMIYQFDGSSFVRLDDPAGAEPFAVPGRIKEHKSLNFREGYLFAITNERRLGTSLVTYKLANKALVKAGTVEGMGVGEELKAVLYANNYAYVVTFRQKDPLFRINLANPAIPLLDGALDVPGFSSQLIANENFLMGIGSNANRRANKVKVSLFDVEPTNFLSELDALDLGVDLNNSHNASATDDQLHHWVPSMSRLYVPYSGMRQRQPSEAFSKICRVGYYHPVHRLSIMQMNGRINEEAVLDFRGSIERVMEYSEDKALAFSTGGVNSLSKSDSGFNNEAVEELFQTEGIYRDSSLPNNWVVAKQVVRAGGQLYKMRFVLGTKEQIVTGTAPHILDIDDSLVSCLGEPQLRFWGDQMLFGHNLHYTRPIADVGMDSIEVQISGKLGWKISNEGFVALGDPEIAGLANRKVRRCLLREGQPTPMNWDEISSQMHDLEVYYVCEDSYGPFGGRILNP